MNLFEDLVEELKDENLLEETVIETNATENQAKAAESMRMNSQMDGVPFGEMSNGDFQRPGVSFNNDLRATPLTMEDNRTFPAGSQNGAQISFNDEMPSTDGFSASIGPAEENLNNEISVEELGFALAMDLPDESGRMDHRQFVPSTPVNEGEFYRRRATEEVSSLKIVEGVLSAVEREHMKIFPKSYDDVAVNVALHDFLKVTKDSDNSSHAQSEFKLMQETESWYSSLSYRDKHISVGDLRRYCETSRPPLSSQALVSLARFYRNSPFSEAVRSKFDMVVTRLFTKEGEEAFTRLSVFSKDELVQQISKLYADWSSVPLYAADDESEVLIAALKFEDFANEARNADSFEELVKNDFFNRLRIFKESTGENFFAPLLTSTAIETNVEVGNLYVELVGRESRKGSVSELEEKYQYLVDQVVSDTTSKTLQLVELLKAKKAGEPVELNEEKEILKFEESAETSARQRKLSRFAFLNINKWIIALGVFSFLFCAGLYVYVEYMTPQMKPSPNVKTVNLENSSLKEFYKTARINKDMFLAITTPAWDGLSKDSKEDVLRKTLEIGSEKGYSTVHLLNNEGKTVGFASKEHGIDLTQEP